MRKLCYTLLFSDLSTDRTVSYLFTGFSTSWLFCYYPFVCRCMSKLIYGFSFNDLVAGRTVSYLLTSFSASSLLYYCPFGRRSVSLLRNNGFCIIIAIRTLFFSISVCFTSSFNCISYILMTSWLSFVIIVRFFTYGTGVKCISASCASWRNNRINILMSLSCNVFCI